MAVHYLLRSRWTFAIPIILALLIGAATGLRAQKQKNIWYFGVNAGLDFNSGVPVPIFGGMITQPEGGASVADPATGDLLFYTDGRTVWNRNHRPMPNGTGLNGGESATQSALIVPVPGERARYVIVTVADQGSDDDTQTPVIGRNETIGVNYSEVDLTLDRGLGDLVKKNIPLVKPASEKVTAVRHCNGRDYWIILRGWHNDAFYAYLLEGSGMNRPPVISHSGHPPLTLAGAIGQMKASPNGAWLALATQEEQAVELFPFDNASGSVGAAIPLLPDSGAYGVSFSPNSSKLYIASSYNNQPQDHITQYDLSSGDPAAILASSYTTRPDGIRYGALQLGPDGRIYLAQLQQGALGVINNPDAGGGAMNFVPSGVGLGGANVLYGLPNMIDADIPPVLCALPGSSFDYMPAICEGTCNIFTDASEGFPTSWSWSFPGGTPSTSTARNPGQVCYGSAGTYEVTLVTTNNYGSNTVRKSLTVRGQQLELDPVAHPDIAHIQLDPTLVNTTRCDSIVLHNRGETPLVLAERDAHMLNGTRFTIASGQYPITIPPHERRGIRICYTPTTTGEEHDGLVLLDSCITIVAYIYSSGTVAPPAAAFSAASVEPCRRECLNFTDNSSGNATSWRWYFPGADPDSSTEQSPRNICFETPGDHTVTLIAGNPFAADTLVRTITVEGTPSLRVASPLDGGTLSLGTIPFGEYRWESVMIRAGDAPVVIGTARLVGNIDYSIPPGQFPLTIPAGGSRALLIGFAPSRGGDLYDTLLIAGDCTPIALPLAGHAEATSLSSTVCSARLEFRGLGAEGLLRIEAPYPNPARTRLMLPVEMLLPPGASAETHCTVYDAMGREVALGSYAGHGFRNGSGRMEEQGAFTIDVSGLPQGAYFAAITIGENVTTIPVAVGR